MRSVLMSRLQQPCLHALMAQGVAAAALLTGVAAAQAQTTPAPPPGVNTPQPGRLSDLEEQLRRAAPRREGDGTGTQIDRLQLDESARPRPENQAGAMTFVLNTLQVLGNTALDQSEIADQVRSYVGKPVTGADLQEMAARITRLYVQRGFVTSRCVVPAQQVVNGAVTLQIEEDKLGSVVLSGASSYRFDLKIFQDQVNDLRGKIINGPELEARLRLVARVPGARVQPTLRKSAFGVTDLVLELSNLDDMGVVAASNDGSSLTSQNRLSIFKTFNNISGASDVLSLSAVVAPDTQYFGGVNAQYQLPIGGRGGKLTFVGAGLYYRLDPAALGTTGQFIRYEGGSRSLDANYEQPFRSAPFKGNALWFVGFENRNVKAATVYRTAFDKPAGYRYVDTEDKLFVLTTGVKYERLDDAFGQRGQTGLALTAKRAMPGWFGAMDIDTINNKLENIAAKVEPVTGPIGDVRGMEPDFLKLIVSAGRVQTLPWAVTVQGTVDVEWSSAKRLPQSYEFAGADNGSRGMRVNLVAQRPLGNSGVNLGAGYAWAKAISYYRDQIPACQTAPGVFAAKSIGRNECSAGNPFVTLSYRSKSVFGDFTYSKLPYFAANQQKLKVNLGVFW
jgi:hypothetical protein